VMSEKLGVKNEELGVWNAKSCLTLNSY